MVTWGGFSWGSSQAGEMVVCQAYTRRPFGSARAPAAAVAAGCAAAVAGAGPAGPAGGAPPQAASSTRLVVLPASIRKLRRDINRANGWSGLRSTCDDIEASSFDGS